MRIAVSEYLKLFFNKIFVICLIVSFFFNSFFLVAMQLSNMENSAIISDTAAYEQLIDECLNSNDKNKFLESKRIETQIAMTISRQSDTLSSNESSLSKYKESFPDEYKTALELHMSEDELYNRTVMIENIAAQISYVNSYDDFISNMQTRAEEQSAFSIFAETDSFSYKNIKKTPKDFAEVSNVEPKIGNNKAYEVSTQFELTDYILILLVLLICISALSAEREKGLYSLVRSTKKGRFATIASKLFVVISVTLVCSIAFYVSNILVCGSMFGFDDLERNIQSSSAFMNCILDISILNYLVIWVLAKSLLLCSVAVLISFLFVIIDSPAKTYIVLAVVFVFEFASAMFVNGNSALGAFKYINIFYLLSGNNIFGYYLNVNLFSEPVNIINVFEVFVVLSTLIGILGSCVAFSKRIFSNGKMNLFEKINSRFIKHKKVNGSVSIYKGEAYKHYKTSFAILAVFLLAFMGFFTLTDDLSILFRTPEESAYNEYMQTLEGVLDEDKYDFIESEKKYFSDLVNKQNEILNNSTLSIDEKTNQINSIQSIIDGKGRAFEDICNQVAYAEKKASLLGEQPALINELVNKRLVQDTFREWKYFIILIASVVFCTSNILACEHKKSMVSLLSANKQGRCRLLLVKLFTVLITTVISFILIYLPYMINFVNTFGTKSFDLPLAFVRNFTMLTSDVTVIEYICILGCMHLTAAISSTAFIYMLSYLLKSQLVTMTVSTGILLIPCILFINNSNVRMVSAFLNGNQTMVIIIITVLCLLTAVLSVFMTFVKYNHLKWRSKNAHA